MHAAAAARILLTTVLAFAGVQSQEYGSLEEDKPGVHAGANRDTAQHNELALPGGQEAESEREQAASLSEERVHRAHRARGQHHESPDL